jgi:hypothetical protein
MAFQKHSSASASAWGLGVGEWFLVSRFWFLVSGFWFSYLKLETWNLKPETFAA